MRRLLLAYNNMAIESDCTIIPIVHLNKGASGDLLDDISGSSQITAAIRSTLGLVKDSDTGEIYLSSIKNNFADSKNTVQFKYEYEFTETDLETAYGKLIPSILTDGRTADDVRTGNMKRRMDKAKSSKAQTISETQLMVARVLCEADGPIGFVAIRAKLERMCKARSEKVPGKNKVEDAVRNMSGVEGGNKVINRFKDGNAWLHEANELTKKMVEEGTGDIDE